jgi:hypothetical protein
MNKMTKIISLVLIAITLFGLTACSNTPDISVDEMLQTGYTMLSPNGETTKKFTLAISQGEKHHYTFSGRVSDGALISSLTVSRNGLKSNYKNMFLVNNGNIHINMNGAMSAAESEIGFTFTDSSALQGKYVTLKNAAASMNEFLTHMHTTTFADWVALRAAKENEKGDYNYNFTYSGDEVKQLLADVATDAKANESTTAEKLDGYIKSWSGDATDIYNMAMLYLQDMVDIDTEEVLGDYETKGTHFTKLMEQEIAALGNLMALDGSYITEGISYSNKREVVFQHTITFCDKNGNAFGSIDFQISEENVDKIDMSVYNYITFEDFLGVFLQNVKNTKGVGYETNDFPYIATYTATQLTLTETNDLYKCTHVFDFEENDLRKYTVTFYTYDTSMHNALMHKYDAMKMKLVANELDALTEGTGSGVLQYESETVVSKYDASDPIELLKLLEQTGVPTYGKA